METDKEIDVLYELEKILKEKESGTELPASLITPASRGHFEVIKRLTPELKRRPEADVKIRVASSVAAAAAYSEICLYLLSQMEDDVQRKWAYIDCVCVAIPNHMSLFERMVNAEGIDNSTLADIWHWGICTAAKEPCISSTVQALFNASIIPEEVRNKVAAMTLIWAASDRNDDLMTALIPEVDASTLRQEIATSLFDHQRTPEYLLYETRGLSDDLRQTLHQKLFPHSSDGEQAPHIWLLESHLEDYPLSGTVAHGLSFATTDRQSPRPGKTQEEAAAKFRPPAVEVSSNVGFIVARRKWGRTGTRVIATDGYVFRHEDGSTRRIYKIFPGSAVRDMMNTSHGLPQTFRLGSSIPYNAIVSIAGVVETTSLPDRPHVYFLIRLQGKGSTDDECWISWTELKRVRSLGNLTALKDAELSARSSRLACEATRSKGADQSSTSHNFWRS